MMTRYRATPAGNVPFTPEEEAAWESEFANPVAPVPADVSAAAARDVLIDAGLMDSIDAAIAAIPDATTRAKAQAWWEYAARIRRDSPWVAMLAPALGLDDDALDDIFRTAAVVEQTA